MGVGNGASSPHFPFALWGLGPMGVSGGLYSTLSAVETPQGPGGVRGDGQGYLREGGALSLIHSSLCLLPTVACLRGLVNCGLHHSWELECRAAVPAQTDQIPLRSSGPFPHQLNWNFRGLGQGVSSRRSLMVARAWGTADPDQLSE